MKKTKTGDPHFETEAEVRNFINHNYSSEAILERALGKKRHVNYDDPMLKSNVLLKAVDRLPMAKYREGKQLLETLIKCSLQRARLVAFAESVNDPLQKQELNNKAKTLTREHVYAWFMKEWHYPFEKVYAIERRAIEGIQDKLSVIGIPMEFGQIAKAGGI